MKKHHNQKLSPANLEIMKIVWDLGDVTINDVFEAINARRAADLKRSTIQVQMRRLERYGWLEHRQIGRTFYYSAVVAKHTTRKDILYDVKNRVFSGSRPEMVKCLLEDSDIGPDEIKELRTLLKEYDEEHESS